MTRAAIGIGLLALLLSAASAAAEDAASTAGAQSAPKTPAESAPTLAALKGLAPVSALSGSPDGRAALGANFAVTGGIETGAIRQPTLLPFPEQQQQALRDAFITDGNLAQLADGLGATLGAAYQARAHYLDRERFTSLSDAVRKVIAYANSTSALGFERRQILFRQRNGERQEAGFRRGLGHLQGRRGRARYFRPRLRPAGRHARRRPLRGLPSLPDRARRSRRSSAPTTSMFRPAMTSTTAARS